MSATAFQRARRKAAHKQEAEVIKTINEKSTVAELRAALSAKGLEFDLRAKKNDLLVLLGFDNEREIGSENED